MLTLESAKEAALSAILEAVKKDCVILDQHTQEKAYGFVFVYNARRYVETGDFQWALGGNGPVVVLHDGSVHMLGTAYPLEETLQRFEAERGLESA
jgi:hypothetical protein